MFIIQIPGLMRKPPVTILQTLMNLFPAKNKSHFEKDIIIG